MTGLVGVSALAWAYLVWMAVMMADMPMDDAMLGVHPWTAVDFLAMFVMWAVMMIGMMVPTAIPMTLIFAAVALKAERQGHPVGSPTLFISGYIVMWTLFSAAATLLQWGLDQAALLSPMMVSNSPALGAGLLIAAGVYQLTPAKGACLDHCRAPAHFISRHWRPGPFGAFLMGIEHGAFCLGCCWVLMGLLFFGGVMNLLWIAAITLFVLLEKALPAGAQAGRRLGAVMILAGVATLLTR